MAHEAIALNYIRDMIDSHPQAIAGSKRDTWACAIEACLDCGQASTACADACLAEGNVEQLRSVVRSALDNADACFAAAKILSRLTAGKSAMLTTQLSSCLDLVRNCETECNDHAKMHEHCRVCADSCRACENALSAVLTKI